LEQQRAQKYQEDKKEDNRVKKGMWTLGKGSKTRKGEKETGKILVRGETGICSNNPLSMRRCIH